MLDSLGEVHLKSKETLKVCIFENHGDSVNRLMGRVVKGACGS